LTCCFWAEFEEEICKHNKRNRIPNEGLVFVEEAGVVWEQLLFDCAAAGGEAGAWGALVGMMLNDLSQSHFSLLRMVAPVVCSGLRIVGAPVV
jgi:hypothetical protein